MSVDEIIVESNDVYLIAEEMGFDAGMTREIVSALRRAGLFYQVSLAAADSSQLEREIKDALVIRAELKDPGCLKAGDVGCALNMFSGIRENASVRGYGSSAKIRFSGAVASIGSNIYSAYASVDVQRISGNGAQEYSPVQCRKQMLVVITGNMALED